MDVTITTEGGRTYLVSPYNASLPSEAKALGGRWDAGRKAWAFDARDEARVRDLAKRHYGTDGRPEDAADLVTVRTHLRQHETRRYNGTQNTAVFAGRIIATRPSRDEDVRLAANVIVVEGELTGCGGSARYPEIDAPENLVVEIRDLPRAALGVQDADTYEIVEEATDTDAVAALLAERETLLARLAEIDAQLPEPEGAEMSTREAAVALGVSIRTVQRWAASGKVAATKTGGRWTITITIPA